jgi:hypothetical protein
MARSRLQATPLLRGLTRPGKRNLPGEVACCLKPELHLRAGPISRFPCVFKYLSTQRYVAAKATILTPWRAPGATTAVRHSPIPFRTRSAGYQHSALKDAKNNASAVVWGQRTVGADTLPLILDTGSPLRRALGQVMDACHIGHLQHFSKDRRGKECSGLSFALP